MKINFKQEARYVGYAAMFGVMCYAASIGVVLGLSKLGWWISDLDKLPFTAEESLNHAVFITSFLTAYAAVRISGSVKEK
jgi:hypothetical protein